MAQTAEIDETAETGEIIESDVIAENNEIVGDNEVVGDDEIVENDDIFDTDEIFDMDEIVVYGESFIPLDKDAIVYVLADIKKMRPIFDMIPVRQLKSWQAALVIDKTEMAAAALFPGVTGRFFQLVGFGSYPSFTANMALFMHRNWKYMFAKKNYYYSERDRLSVRLSSNEIYAVGWRRTQVNPVPEEPGVKMPEGFTAFRHRSGESAPLSLWMENQDSILNRMFDDEGITVNLPVERLFLNLYHVEENLFKADIVLQISALFSWKNFLVSSSTRSDSVLKALFLANPPVKNSRNVAFQSALLSKEDIVSLMRVFLINWK